MLLFRVSDSVYRNPALEMRHFIFRNPQSEFAPRILTRKKKRKGRGRPFRDLSESVPEYYLFTLVIGNLLVSLFRVMGRVELMTMPG